ncbi:MAG TPA: hypothetical protein VMB03_24345 [Bryobacteraceae bacterium]|nr:hypothetical protein [Bryobacteraceae bacterium]
MKKVAIADFGSARVKLTVAQLRADVIHWDCYREELNTARQLSTSLAFGEESCLRLVAAAERIRDFAQDQGCDHMIGVGTEAFRSASDGEDAARRLSRILPGFRVLSPEEEGALLFSAVSGEPGDNQMCVVDVGGASVQIVWIDQGLKVISLPLGPGLLEGAFQAQPWAADSEFQRIKEYIDKRLTTSLPQTLRRSRIVFGSTCMAEFIRSAMHHFSIDEAVGADQPNTDLMAVLMIEMRALKATEVVNVYPQNPSFAMGADKTLLIVSMIAGRVGANTAVPTDESISTAIARQLLRPATGQQSVTLSACRLQ